MSHSQMHQFDERLRRIDREHRALSRGFVLSVAKDGLVIAKPETGRKRFPWRTTLFVLAIVMAFKIMLHAYLGPEAYEERVARLAAGTTAEQIGAYVMAADPVTTAVSAFVTGR